jgi:hypothetical protein
MALVHVLVSTWCSKAEQRKRAVGRSGGGQQQHGGYAELAPLWHASVRAGATGIYCRGGHVAAGAHQVAVL